MPRSNVRNKNRGFTLAEQAVLIAVMGVLVMMTAPSLIGMFDRFKLDQAIVSVRGALQESQRQAIRLSQACVVSLDLSGGNVTGPCLVTGDRTLPEQVDAVTNIKPTKIDGSDKNSGAGNNKTGIQLTFGVLGTAEFIVESAGIASDPSGKFVFYMPETAVKDRKCIAISSTLGLTRVGVYSGELKHSKDLSKGTCTAIE
ncbi:MAG: type II secretion system GspH family protein [Aphanocapsa sp. GSE-SYN-MK-11-07L]|jgi:type II secretory pathway pseudopilin PulG|nr:type II secretion system GspH family protein [Aphanocapsa sp. GSE-SYN-MK-11-07L]